MTKGRFKHEAARNGRTTDIDPTVELLRFAGQNRFSTILADPPWRFVNRTGKMAPEHRRLARYDTMTVEEIAALPVARILKPTAHLYLWVPNALLPDGIKVLPAQTGPLNEDPGPHSGGEFVFPDDLAGPANQHDQQVESTTADGHTLAGSDQQPLRREKFEWSECDGLLRHGLGASLQDGGHG
jgi:MT-A70 protein